MASYTKFPYLRLDIPVTVALTKQLDRVRQKLMDLVEGYDDFMADRHPAQ